MPWALAIHVPAITASPRRVVLRMVLLSAVAVFTVGSFAFIFLAQPAISASNPSGPASSAFQITPSLAATSSSTSSAISSNIIPTRQVTIGNDGLTYLEGVRIDSIAGTVITATISWGTMTLPFTIETKNGKGGTQFILPDGSEGSMNDLTIGDTVDVTGMLDTAASQPTINAQFVRE